MNDAMPDFSKMARQLAEALNLPDWDQLDDAQLEVLLESTDAEPLSESQQEAILQKAQLLIHQWETSPMAAPSDETRSDVPKRQPLATAASHSSVPSERLSAKRNGSGSAVLLAGIALLAMGLLFYQSRRGEDSTAKTSHDAQTKVAVANPPFKALRPAAKLESPAAVRVDVGSSIETRARERRRVTLPDGSVAYLNENTRVEVKTARRLSVQHGEVFVEVVPASLIAQKTPFVVETPHDRDVTALGTKFSVKADKLDTSVLVTQGRVKVQGVPEPLTAGQQLKQNERLPAPRASEALLWTKELMAAAESPLIPKSEHAGGALVAIDPSGQEMQLSLRKQHIDVHIEDGFARTTIDQTYFNSSWSQMEGTFYFPLPADASLSRLAMYVGENLMEGGMAERDHARNVFEQIRYTRRDPALLEWVDGSTFKMRVFPLEARQEKRIVISYTQRLQSAYGQLHYRFPAGHSLELIRDWSTQILVKNHGDRQWKSPSHKLESQVANGDLVLEKSVQGVIDDRDLVIELEDEHEAHPQADAARFSRMAQDGYQYLMLRFRPDLRGDLNRKPRNWVFLFESAGNRDSLLARVQIEVLHTLLKNAEHADTFSLITAATRPKTWKDKPVPCTPANIEAALKHLNEVHLVGALDLEKALTACGPFLKAKPASANAENYLVHLGAGVAVLGKKETNDLLAKIPAKAKYVGVGVGKHWSQDFMKAAANRTGGYVTQINPDEQIGWRSFELLSLLNAPRVLNVQVTDGNNDHRYLQFTETLAKGEELGAVIRLGEKDELPETLTITGQLEGKPYKKSIPVTDAAEGAGYLPRTWAKLEIDRLIAAGAAENKNTIIELSKAMYVMSPFTSLLVLENEQMYEQFKVDRGRKDHWALYPCPPKIAVVYEPNGPKPVNRIVSSTARAKSVEDLLKTVLVRTPPVTYRWSNGAQTTMQGVTALQLYTGAFALPVADIQNRLSKWAYMPPASNFGDEIAHFGRDGRLRVWSGDMLSMQYGMPGPATNLWFDEDFDGVSNTAFLGAIPPMSGPGVSEWSGPVTWSRPMLRSGTEYDFSQPASAVTANPLMNEGLIRTYSDFASPNFGPFYPDSGLANGRWGGVSSWQRNVVDHYFDASGLWGEPTVRFRRMPPVNLQIQNGRIAAPMTVPQLVRMDPELPRILVEMEDLTAMPEGFMIEMPTPTVDFIQPPATLGGFASSASGGLVSTPEMNPHFGLGFSGEDRISQLYPQTAGHWSLGRFGDLAAHAPGLNTLRVDVLSLLESQGPTERLPKRGAIDPKAQAVIERARQQGWEAVTLPHEKGESGFTLRCDAQGRYVYERTLSEGLKERVLSDGESLLHLYDEIGLGGRRGVNRFHRAELRRLVPWLVPPAEDLAVGCDVRFVNENAIAVVPMQKEDAEATSVYLLMVFRENGQLQERRLVDGTTEKSLLRVEYDPAGTVSIFDKEDNRIGEIAWKRTAANEPDLKPDLKDLVVLSLPHRSPESFLTPDQQQLANTSQFLPMSEDAALTLLGSYYATGNVNQLNNLLNQRHFGNEDFRLGLYVLQAGVYQQTGLGNQATLLTAKHPNSPLAQYLWQHFTWANTGNAEQEFVVNGPEDGFVQRLAMARNLYARWETGRAVKNRSATEIRGERERSLAELKKLRSPGLAWMILKIMQAADTSTQGLASYIQAADEFAQKPGLSLTARYQAALWRSDFGETAEAVKQLKNLNDELLKHGQLPPITEQIRDVYIHHNGIKAWTSYLKDLQSGLLKDKKRPAALAVAIRAARIKQDKLSEELLANALMGLEPDEQPYAAVLAANHLIDQKRYADAERFLGPMLKLKGWSQLPELWRKASELASLKNDEPLSVARLERAMQLEYERLPDLINLQTIRSDYQTLLNRIQGLAAFENPESDLKQRAVRVADRWRVLDPDDTAACQTAARIVAQLGDEDLAWDYLTTPLADKPNESGPWVALAQELTRQQKIDLADRAYRQAFEAEATNAQILWDHALFLLAHDREEDARELLEQIARENWQPRFAPLKTQAQQRLNGLDATTDIPK